MSNLFKQKGAFDLLVSVFSFQRTIRTFRPERKAQSCESNQLDRPDDS